MILLCEGCTIDCTHSGTDPCTLRSVWLKRHSELLGLPPPWLLITADQQELLEEAMDYNPSGVVLYWVLVPTSRFGPACIDFSFPELCTSIYDVACTRTGTEQAASPSTWVPLPAKTIQILGRVSAVTTRLQLPNDKIKILNRRLVMQLMENHADNLQINK